MAYFELIPYLLSIIYALGTSKSHLSEMVLLCIHKIYSFVGNGENNHLFGFILFTTNFV